MCFSPEADLIAGVVVGGAGVDALRHVRHRREIGIAALPLVFGTHQMTEALVWWGLDGRVAASIGDAATWVYLVVAFALPIVVPLAVRGHETDPGRRRGMAPFAVLGGIVAAVLYAELFAGPATATECTRYLAYDIGLRNGGAVAAGYIAATCLPLLLASERRIALFGVANLAAVSVLAVVVARGVISLWCAWAAVASLLIVAHLRRRAPDRVTTPVAVR